MNEPRAKQTMQQKRHDDSWFHDASARFFTSLGWAVVIIVLGTVFSYLASYFL
jgi:hypothetical protein